jgi:hypothetical protein
MKINVLAVLIRVVVGAGMIAMSLTSSSIRIRLVG